MSPSPSLPPEILLEITKHAAGRFTTYSTKRQDDIRSLCLVSHAWYSAAHVELPVVLMLGFQPSSRRKNEDLLRAIDAAPEVFKHTRGVTLSMVPSKEDKDEDNGDPSQEHESLDAILTALPQIEDVSVNLDFTGHSPYDSPHPCLSVIEEHSTKLRRLALYMDDYHPKYLTPLLSGAKNLIELYLITGERGSHPCTDEPVTFHLSLLAVHGSFSSLDLYNLLAGSHTSLRYLRVPSNALHLTTFSDLHTLILDLSCGSQRSTTSFATRLRIDKSQPTFTSPLLQSILDDMLVMYEELISSLAVTLSTVPPQLRRLHLVSTRGGEFGHKGFARKLFQLFPTQLEKVDLHGLRGLHGGSCLEWLRSHKADGPLRRIVLYGGATSEELRKELGDEEEHVIVGDVKEAVETVCREKDIECRWYEKSSA